jgi:hypothetical protein
VPTWNALTEGPEVADRLFPQGLTERPLLAGRLS